VYYYGVLFHLNGFFCICLLLVSVFKSCGMCVVWVWFVVIVTFICFIVLYLYLTYSKMLECYAV